MGLATKLKAFNAMRQMDNGWQLILNRLMFPSEPIQFCRYRGLEFMTDLAGGDATGAREVLTSDEYAKHLPSIFCERPLNVLDLGSNNGGFPLLLLANGFEIAKFVGVEFNPSTYRRLRFNTERNLPGKSFLINAAVSGDGRAVRIGDSQGSTGDSIYTAEDGSRSLEVAGSTIDEIIETAFGGDKIDVCKIDIEGAEFEALLGETCRRLVQADLIIIEIHHGPGRDRSEVRDRLRELGFSEEDAEGKDDDRHHVHVFRRESAS